jgi:hypothetical protein
VPSPVLVWCSSGLIADDLVLQAFVQGVRFVHFTLLWQFYSTET